MPAGARSEGWAQVLAAAAIAAVVACACGNAGRGADSGSDTGAEDLADSQADLGPEDAGGDPDAADDSATDQDTADGAGEDPDGGLDADADAAMDGDAIDGDAAEEDAWEYEHGSLASCLLDPACRRVGVASHMGAWTAAIPGNSMAAYERAWTLGADAIEADVRVSRDGVPFMIHSDTIQAYESAFCAGRVVSESDASDIDGCLLLPSFTETIPTFEEFVSWARGRILIHLDVKESDDIAIMVDAIHAHAAEDYVFIAVSTGEAATIVPAIPGESSVNFMLRVGSVAEIDLALGDLARPNIFMLEGDRSWADPAVSESDMILQIARVHATGLRIMASSTQLDPPVDDHAHLYDMGFDYVLSYGCENGVAAAAEVNIARGYAP